MDELRRTAKQIVSYCHSDNIEKVYCCVTRLRLHFKNKDIVDYGALSALACVKGIFWFGEECQLVIGIEALTLSQIINAMRLQDV